MDAPTHYDDIHPEALALLRAGIVTDMPTLLMYSHICRGDLALRNEDGQLFYDPENNGFGWSGDRAWVKKRLAKLVKLKLVEFKSRRDCRDGSYTSWYFYKPGADLDDLVDASCNVTAWRFFLVRHYLNLPDGFDRNGSYGDFVLTKGTERGEYERPYSFRYKGEANNIGWDCNGAGKESCRYDFEMEYETFGEMVLDMWSYLARDGAKALNRIPGTTERRRVYEKLPEVTA